MPYDGSEPSTAPAPGFFGAIEPAWRVVKVRLRPGIGGVHDTLNAMADKAQEESIANNVRQVATGLARGAPTAKDAPIAVRVRDGIRARFDYYKDPSPFEYVIAPNVSCHRLIHSGKAVGDCDDLSILQAGILAALGIPARLVAIGTRRGAGRYSHVFCEVKLNGVWYSMDHLVPPDAEWLLPAITREV